MQQQLLLSPLWQHRLTRVIKRLANILVSNWLLNVDSTELSDVFFDLSGADIAVTEQLKGFNLEHNGGRESDGLSFTPYAPIFQRML
jgi:hypothetical protein